MTVFVLIHGAGDSGWSWHLVAAELRARGHRAVAPDLPEDPAADLNAYADVVVAAVQACGPAPGSAGDAAGGVVVVAHSFGAFTAPLVAERLGAAGLVFVAGMVPAPGERPSQWWAAAGHRGTGEEDPYVTYYHDVPRPLAEEALRRQRAHPSTVAYEQPWPMAAMPAVPVRFVLLRQDRCFPPELLRRLVPRRLGIVPEEFDAGHCAALGRPRELAALLLDGAWPAR